MRITGLLIGADTSTGFSDCFTHQRSRRPAEDRPVLLAAILADGINLGLTRMAETCRGMTLRQLAWVHDWHVREEGYTAALVRLIEAHRALPLAQAWGDGTTSSWDGQYFRAGGRGSGLGDINARHGNEPGVAFYTHVPDQFGPFHTRVIAAAASEAPHVLDGCSTTRQACNPPSTTPTPAAPPTTCSACAPCWASGSHHGCATTLLHGSAGRAARGRMLRQQPSGAALGTWRAVQGQRCPPSPHPQAAAPGDQDGRP